MTIRSQSYMSVYFYKSFVWTVFHSKNRCHNDVNIATSDVNANGEMYNVKSSYMSR